MNRNTISALIVVALAWLPDAQARRPEPRKVYRNASLDKPQRLSKASQLLRRSLDRREKKAIIRAHKVGRGQPGKNPELTAGVLPDGSSNFLFRHLRRKAKILRAAGLNRQERRVLFQHGIVGKRSRRGQQNLDDISQMSRSWCPDVAGGAGKLLSYIQSGHIDPATIDPQILQMAKWQVEDARRAGGMAGFQRDERVKKGGAPGSFFRKKR